MAVPDGELTLAPFPHWVGQAFDGDLLGDVLDEIEACGATDSRWKRFGGAHEQKMEGSDPSMWGPATDRYYDKLRQLTGWIGELFRFSGLEVDTYGGGWHAIPPGGHLDMHVDFNRHPDGRHRRVNVLTYLNRDWEDDGGHIILGDPPEAAVAPEFGVTVMFPTDDRSWHGHPKPASRWRFSIAGYLYDRTDPGAPHSTVWTSP